MHPIDHAGGYMIAFLQFLFLQFYLRAISFENPAARFSVHAAVAHL
jgi:hypothetical protein